MTGYRPGIVLLSSIVAAVFVAALAPMAWPQTPAVDPRALIGQWSGSWVSYPGDSTNGKYYLTIERIDGEKVFGKGELWGRKTIEFTVKGTLSGNRLTYGRTELTITDNEMVGAGPDVKIRLSKKK